MTATLDPHVGDDVLHAPIGLPVPLTHHAWYPLSPCGSGCMSHDRRRRRTLATFRLLRLVVTIGWCAVVALTVLMAPRLVRRKVASRSSRAILRAVGVRVEIDDRRPFPSHGRGLVVANHISYLDVLAVAVVAPSHFVAKSDVAAIPVISVLARWLGVISVERNSLRRLPATIDEVIDVLEQDRSVAVFPEGTTRCGRTTGRFRPAFFQAAIEAGVPVQPLGIRYSGRGGELDTAAGFIGDDSIVDTLRRVLYASGLTVHVRVHEPQLPVGDRLTLARRCERLAAA